MDINKLKEKASIWQEKLQDFALKSGKRLATNLRVVADELDKYIDSVMEKQVVDVDFDEFFKDEDLPGENSEKKEI